MAIIPLYRVKWLVLPKRSVFTERYGMNLKMEIRLILVFKSSPIPRQSIWDLWWTK